MDVLSRGHFVLRRSPNGMPLLCFQLSFQGRHSWLPLKFSLHNNDFHFTPGASVYTDFMGFQDLSFKSIKLVENRQERYSGMETATRYPTPCQVRFGLFLEQIAPSLQNKKKNNKLGQTRRSTAISNACIVEADRRK